MRPVLHFLTAATLLIGGPFVQGNDEYTFRHENPVVGEQWANKVQFDMSMKMRYRYPGQEIQETSNKDRQRQLRRLTVLEVQPGYSTKVKVFFERARRQQSAIDQENQEWLPQPVDGKTYIVRREGDQLVVTNMKGSVPPEEELSIVQHSMQAVGRPNTLARFLSGRTIAIGETIRLPGDLASSFLGSPEGDNVPQEMPMKLVEVRDIDGVACGIFAAQMENVKQNSPRTSSHMNGYFALQMNTCRVVYVKFSGPVTFRQTRMIANQEYTVEATGSLAVAMRTSSIPR